LGAVKSGIGSTVSSSSELSSPTQPDKGDRRISSIIIGAMIRIDWSKR